MGDAEVSHLEMSYLSASFGFTRLSITLYYSHSKHGSGIKWIYSQFPGCQIFFPMCSAQQHNHKLHCCFVKKVKPLPSYLEHCSLIKGIQPLLCRHQVCWRHERKWSALLILEEALKISPLKTKAYRSNTKVLFCCF